MANSPQRGVDGHSYTDTVFATLDNRTKELLEQRARPAEFAQRTNCALNKT